MTGKADVVLLVLAAGMAGLCLGVLLCRWAAFS